MGEVQANECLERMMRKHGALEHTEAIAVGLACPNLCLRIERLEH